MNPEDAGGHRAGRNGRRRRGPDAAPEIEFHATRDARIGGGRRHGKRRRENGGREGLVRGWRDDDDDDDDDDEDDEDYKMEEEKEELLAKMDNCFRVCMKGKETRGEAGGRDDTPASANE